MKRSLAFGLAVSALGLAGCDNTPNTQFEQQLKDRDAASSDRYAELESSVPRQGDYIRSDADTRRDMTSGQAGTYRARYEGLLDTLAGDKAIDTKSPLFAACRPAFTAAIAFQRGTRPAAAMTPDAAAAALRTCRGRAQAAVSAGKADAGGAALLSRFASAGLVLVGVAAVGRGDEQAGLAVWREGEMLSRRDRPGFRIDASSFR